MKDPQRWVDDPAAPKGSGELLRALERPPVFDESVRGRVRDQLAHAAVPATPQLAWRAPVLGATAVVLAGLLLWRFQPVDEPEVELRPEVAAEVDRAAESAPAASSLARVRVTTDPMGAAIYVDDEMRGVSPLELELAAGTYVVEARLAGYASASVSHQVAAGERASVALALAAEAAPVVASMERRTRRRPETVRTRNPPGQTGTLVVNTMPWSRVYVDGREIGITPIRNHRLPVGRHRVRFETAGGVAQTATVTIRPDSSTRLIRRLDNPSTMSLADNPF